MQFDWDCPHCGRELELMECETEYDCENVIIHLICPQCSRSFSVQYERQPWHELMETGDEVENKKVDR